MKKNIENITEELIMRYVEGGLSQDENEKFNTILDKNEYLRERVSKLESIMLNEPSVSPSIEAHNKILEDLNITKKEPPFILSYLNKFFKKFDDKPILLASSISCLVIIFVICMININQGNSIYNNKPDNNVGLGKTEDNNAIVDQDKAIDTDKESEILPSEK